jgi:DNA-binding MarR family transcriptional regulator
VRESAAVGDQMARLIRLVGAWKQRVRDEHFGDRVLLGRLAECGSRRATDLAADTLLDLSTVSRQIRSLVEQGLVERRPDPEDGRGTLLSPTVDGLAAVERYRAQRDQQLADALAGWPAADRRDFARFLARFNDDFAEHHVRPVCTAPHGAGHAHPHGGTHPHGAPAPAGHGRSAPGAGEAVTAPDPDAVPPAGTHRAGRTTASAAPGPTPGPVPGPAPESVPGTAPGTGSGAHSGPGTGLHDRAPEPAGLQLPHHRRARSTGQIQENP